MLLHDPIFSEDGSHLYRFVFLAAQDVLRTTYKWRNAVETDPHGVDFTKALGELDVVVRHLGVVLAPPVVDGQYIDPWDRPNWRDIPNFLCWAVAPSIEQVDIERELAQTRRGEMFSALGLSGPSVHKVVYKLGEATWNAFFRIPPNQDQPAIDALLGADSVLRTEIQGLGAISAAEKDLLNEECRYEAGLAWENAKARGSEPLSSGGEELEARPADEGASKKTDPKEKAGVLDLLVDENKRSIRRLRYDKAVDLSGALVRWHIFSVAYSAAPEQATLDDLKDDYPGEWDARRNAVSELNGELKKIGIRVHNRTLQLVAPTSPGR